MKNICEVDRFKEIDRWMQATDGGTADDIGVVVIELNTPLDGSRKVKIDENVGK